MTSEAPGTGPGKVRSSGHQPAPDENSGAPVPAGFKRHEYSVNGVRTVVLVGGSGRPVV